MDGLTLLDISGEAVTAAWMVRAGRDGEREPAALAEGLAIAGWLELGDISDCQSRDELRAKVADAYPDGSRARIGNWTGQLWRFLRLMSEDDYVVLPLKTNPDHVAIGRITGPYRYRHDAEPGFRHVRDVQWVQKALPRSAFGSDLLASMGSLLTVCRLRRYGAESRIASLAQNGVDSGRGPAEPTADSRTPYDILDAAVSADPSEPLRLTIRELIGKWGFARRTSQVVAQIESDLADKGLTTRPPFTDGWIGNTVELVQVGEEPAPGERVSDPIGIPDPAEPSDITTLTLRVADLPSANNGTAAVNVGDSLDAAITLMIAKNYSQLAVIDNTGALCGAVSWESIGRKRFAQGEVDLTRAMFQPRTVDYHADLLSQIGEIFARGFVFVRKMDDVVFHGIITAADLTLRFGSTARPFILIEEAELRLRRRVEATIDIEIIRSTLEKPKISSAADLTLGNYKYLFTEENYKLLGWPFDRVIFIQQMEKVRRLRNDLMHFSPDEQDEVALEDLQGFVDMLRLVDSDTDGV